MQAEEEVLTIGPVTIIGEHETGPKDAIKLLPFPFDHHFFRWWSDTTRDVLIAMGETDLRGLHVLDFGCGASAILAMAAVRMGAAKVTALDQIPSLIAEARRQLKANNLDKKVQLVIAREPMPCDFLIANVGEALLAGKVSTAAPHGIATDNDGNLIRW